MTGETVISAGAQGAGSVIPAGTAAGAGPAWARPSSTRIRGALVAEAEFSDSGGDP